MAAIQQALMAVGGIPYAVDAADFDGTNDYLLRGAGLTGAADSKVGTISFWFRMDGGAGSQLAIFESTLDRFTVDREGTNAIRVIGLDGGGTERLNIATTSAFTTSATWHHFWATWDLSVADTWYIYIDGSSQGVKTTFANVDVDFTSTDWAVGAKTDGTIKFNGCLAEL